MIDSEINNGSDIIYNNFDISFELVKEGIDKALASTPLVVRKYTEHLKASTGKFIRARSLLICAENAEGLINQDAVNLAVAIELFHLATLVHDDVIDDADLRRGNSTLQKKYGKRTAVICGDYVFCIALKELSKITNKDKYIKLDLPDYIGKVCLGELNQHIRSGFFDLSPRQYLKIISGKTAALFEASFCAGAIICGSEDKEVKKYMRLGHYIGMIFQIADDCMNFVTEIDIAKKPVQSDFEQGVITLPLIHAFKNFLGLKDRAIAQKLTRKEINEAVEETGGLNYAGSLSKKYYEKSMKIIRNLSASEIKKRKLLEILGKASGVT